MLPFVRNTGSNDIYAEVNRPGASQRVEGINIQIRRPHETGATDVTVHMTNVKVCIQHKNLEIIVLS
jgi:hypothetical protein